MRSARNRILVAVALAVAAVAGVVLPLGAQAPRTATPAPDEEIQRALTEVRADPNLSSETTIKMLRWRSSGRQDSPWPGRIFSWLGGAFRWLDPSARVLVWVVAIFAGTAFAILLIRALTPSADPADKIAFIAPTHVRDLDIRPESLPYDVGAAVRALWDRGERRAALALLYRALLSRLVHVHKVEIRESSTEGDCLRLAGEHLPAPRMDYVRELVTVWQRAVYGHESIGSEVVYVLADGFARQLAPADEARS